jgi:hypothetical protein
VASPSRSQSPDLPKPGAKVSLDQVSNTSGHAFDVDAVALLRDAMTHALRVEGVYAEPGTPGQAFRLTLRISEYRPGNAFKRWLLPGYGSTVLAVTGELRDAKSGAVAASINHERSVLWGGAYTIGAWKYIFDDVADDIAKDLKLKIEKGGEFVVSLPPRSDRTTAVGPVKNPIAIKILPMNDRRDEKGRIGERFAAFGVSMGDVYFSQSVPQFLESSLADELVAMGDRIVTSKEQMTVSPTLRKFWLTTETTPLYWDVIAEVQLGLEIAPTPPTASGVARAYSCKSTDRTYVWPTADLLSRVLENCMTELWSKVRSDDVWRPGVS